MPFHETNRGYVSGNHRVGGNVLFAQNRQPKIGEANAPVRNGYLYYISGGLAASNNITAMTNTQDDYLMVLTLILEYGLMEDPKLRL